MSDEWRLDPAVEAQALETARLRLRVDRAEGALARVLQLCEEDASQMVFLHEAGHSQLQPIPAVSVYAVRAAIRGAA